MKPIFQGLTSARPLWMIVLGEQASSSTGSRKNPEDDQETLRRQQFDEDGTTSVMNCHLSTFLSFLYKPPHSFSLKIHEHTVCMTFVICRAKGYKPGRCVSWLTYSILTDWLLPIYLTMLDFCKSVYKQTEMTHLTNMKNVMFVAGRGGRGCLGKPKLRNEHMQIAYWRGWYQMEIGKKWI